MTDLLLPLREANPVAHEPVPMPVEVLLVRLRREPLGPPHRRPIPWKRPIIAVAVVVVLGLGLVLLGRPGESRSLNVAAAAYRAADPGAGILHVVSTNTTASSGGKIRIRQELWADRDRRSYRKVMVIDAVGAAPIRREFTQHGNTAQVWTSQHPNQVIQQQLQSFDWPLGNDPVAFLRAAYQDGSLKVKGRDTVDGHEVWTLEAVDSKSSLTAQVDAQTFVPVEIVTRVPGRKESATTTYSTFQTLPSTGQNRRLMKMSDHPGASVVIRP